VDGDSTTARFKKPLGVAVHPDGTWVAVADALNHRFVTGTTELGCPGVTRFVV
jgi:hypothetical protein